MFPVGNFRGLDLRHWAGSEGPRGGHCGTQAATPVPGPHHVPAPTPRHILVLTERSTALPPFLLMRSRSTLRSIPSPGARPHAACGNPGRARPLSHRKALAALRLTLSSQDASLPESQLSGTQSRPKVLPAVPISGLRAPNAQLQPRLTLIPTHITGWFRDQYFRYRNEMRDSALGHVLQFVEAFLSRLATYKPTHQAGDPRRHRAGDLAAKQNTAAELAHRCNDQRLAHGEGPRRDATAEGIGHVVGA